MFSVETTRTTLRMRIHEVATEWMPVARILKRIEGHLDTWTLPDASNLRRMLNDMLAKGQVEARWNAADRCREWRVPPDRDNTPEEAP